MKHLDFKIAPKDAFDLDAIKLKAAKKLRLPAKDIKGIAVLRRSIDARGAKPLYNLRIAVYLGELPVAEPDLLPQIQLLPPTAKEIIVVGAGPAGYFAALELIELGLRPIVIDRGKPVRERRRDLRAIQQEGIVNPHSNYCFGEGGAGTYSDGKLYTRSLKRGNYKKVLQLLVEHGAETDILVDAHPHIGSNKLPKIVTAIRETIEKLGGQVIFDAQVTDFLLTKGKMTGVVINKEIEKQGDAVILATGHSARDIYHLLHKKGIRIESKPFALGVRIEHPQKLIDSIQYNQEIREENLPASSYKLVCQVQERGVFSFCMCPGGLIVPSSTAPGELVVNGMSLSKRDSDYANSGTVVAVETEDLKDYRQHGVFAGLAFQKAVEQQVFQAGDGSQKAPAQRLTDFARGRLSRDLPSTSYIPGIYAAELHRLLPPFIGKRLQEAVRQFDRKMKGYFTKEAIVVGTESRTSSPIRIPRSRETFMHEDVKGLFPCGEGAGYAGGILSAAMDGQNVARAVALSLKH